MVFPYIAMMVIDNAVLLQVDVTAVLGLLIFLTIGQRATERRELSYSTAGMVIPFAISALMVLVDDTWMGNVNFFVSRFFTALGFFLILLYFGLIIAVKELRDLREWWRDRRQS